MGLDFLIDYHFETRGQRRRLTQSTARWAGTQADDVHAALNHSNQLPQNHLDFGKDFTQLLNISRAAASTTEVDN